MSSKQGVELRNLPPSPGTVAFTSPVQAAAD
jgi:hypothetical protein